MKDPAALMYIDTWLTSTAEMDADCRGWYLNLILHQYDKKSLPNDIEKLAVLASVKFSEFQRFKQVFEQMLKQKFDIGEDGRLRNKKADEVLQSRKKFTDKRSKSGSVGVVVKLARTIGYKPNEIELLKADLYLEKVDIEQAKDKQMLKQMLKLYRNVDEDVNKEYIEDELDLLKPTEFDEFWNLYGNKIEEVKCKREWFSIDHAEYPKIIEHVPKFVNASGKFLCKPLNYLEGRRWKDEQLPNYASKEEPKKERFIPTPPKL